MCGHLECLNCKRSPNNFKNTRSTAIFSLSCHSKAGATNQTLAQLKKFDFWNLSGRRNLLFDHLKNTP